jgi:hypothetical protein
VPIVQIPVEFAYEPSAVDADTNVTPEGRTSVATTPNDVEGPVALTVSV